MASRKDIGLYIPDEQTATILFTKKGDTDPETGESVEVTVMWMEVKADLTFDDRQRLFWNEDEMPQRMDADGEPMVDKNGKPLRDPRPDEEIWDIIAPFVLDWSVGRKDAKGKAVKVPPPAEAGGEQFRLINPAYVAKLLSDLRFRSSGKVSTDFLARQPSSVARSSVGSTPSTNWSAKGLIRTRNMKRIRKDMHPSSLQLLQKSSAIEMSGSISHHCDRMSTGNK